jgi:hypothetical protein
MPIEIYYILLKMLPSSIISINEIFSTKIWQYCRFQCHYIYLRILYSWWTGTGGIVIDQLDIAIDELTVEPFTRSQSLKTLRLKIVAYVRWDFYWSFNHHLAALNISQLLLIFTESPTYNCFL